MPVTLESNRILIDTVEVETVKTHVPEVDIDIDIVPAITNSEGDPAFELLTYTHSGGSEDQTEFNLTINENTKCDILIVGGGGGGGSYLYNSAVPGGGGGAGGLIFLENQTIPAGGSYTIKVGKGGLAAPNTTTIAGNGYNSSFSYLQTESVGGGGGGNRNNANGNNNIYTMGNNGGSGGGSARTNYVSPPRGGLGTNGNIVKYDGTILKYNYIQGYNGGAEYTDASDSSLTADESTPFAGGGGGAGGRGMNGHESPDQSIDGNGGVGRAGEGSIDFKILFGITDTNIGEHHTDGKIYFAGGGASGSVPINYGGFNNENIGGLGGGGDGLLNQTNKDGKPNTGGGGAGGKSKAGNNGGNGGSGIVIIKKYLTPSALYETQTTVTQYPVLPADATNLVAHYKFDDEPVNNGTLTNYGTGGTTYNGTIYIANNGIEKITGDVSDTKYHWKSDASDGNYISVPPTILSQLYNTGHSISFWSKDASTTDADYTVISTSSTGNSVNVYIRIHTPWGNGKVYYDNGDGSGTYKRLEIVGGLTNNQLVHWTFTRENLSNGTQIKTTIYKNGSVLSSGTYDRVDFDNATSSACFFIGYNTTGSLIFKDKSLEDFRIYDKVLTAYEIDILANNKIENPDYNILTFTHETVTDLVYDFTDKNSLSTWVNYANSLPGGSTNVTSYSNIDGVYIGGDPAGYFKLQLPIDYDSVEITFYNIYSQGLVNLYIDTLANIDTSTAKLSLSAGQSDTRIWEYTNGDYLKIDETGISIIGANLKLVFKKTQTEYTVNFPEETECDILIVGGGGAGGSFQGGGGGGGGVIYVKNKIIESGNYIIKVGKGGEYPSTNYSTPINNGFDTSFKKESSLLDIDIAYGGGAGTANGASGNQIQYVSTNSANTYLDGVPGGSGGGSGAQTNMGGGAVSTQITSSTNTFLTQNKTVYINDLTMSDNTGYYIFGNISGSYDSTAGAYVGTGGGGAGEVGKSVSGSGAAKRKPNGNGGNGIEINITGNSYYWAGGGGGGAQSSDGGDGGLGGGGGGGSDYGTATPPYVAGIGGGQTMFNSGYNGLRDDIDGDNKGGNGGDNSGGGGGGGGWADHGGNGGSGIVIIRYNTKYIRQHPAYDAQWTYHSANPNVHHYGNVGMGTEASETNKLTVKGDMNMIGNYKQNDVNLGNWYSSDNIHNIHRLTGNVGIGTTDPQYSIDTSGVLYASHGGFTGGTSTNWATSSDERIKENITLASNETCFENVKNINLYKFNYKEQFANNKNETQYGFIAQEVQKYYPKAVKYEKIKVKDDTYENFLTINQTQLNYTLFGAVKHLQQELDTIKVKLGMVEPIQEEPVAEETNTTEEPVAEETNTTEEPVAEETNTTEEPVAEETNTTEEPVAEETNTTEEPVTEETNTTEEPVTEEPVTEEPVAEETNTN